MNYNNEVKERWRNTEVYAEFASQIIAVYTK